MEQTNPETILREALALLPSVDASCIEVDLIRHPDGILYCPPNQRRVMRIGCYHDPAGDAPHGAPWRLVVVYSLAPMRGSSERCRVADHGWNAPPDPREVASRIREVL